MVRRAQRRGPLVGRPDRAGRHPGLRRLVRPRRPTASAPTTPLAVVGVRRRAARARPASSPCSRPSTWSGSASRSSRPTSTRSSTRTTPSRCTTRSLRYAPRGRLRHRRGLRPRRRGRAAPGTPGSRRWSSTRCCAPRPTRRVLSRASALGWGAHGDVAVVLGAVPRRPGRDRRLRRRTPLGSRRRAWTRCAPPRATGSSSCSAASPTRQGRDPAASTTSATGPVVVGPGHRRPGPRPRVSARAALSAHRAASGWPDAPAAGAQRRPAARAGARRRRPRPAAPRRRGLPAAGRRPRHPDRDAGGLLRARLVDRGHGARAVRAPQHGALPAAPGRRPHRLVTDRARATRSRCRSRWSWAGSPGATRNSL